jgi:hypothetical protein
MSVLYITELVDLGKSHSAGAAQMAKLPAIAEQTIAIGAASVQCAPLNLNTRYVRLCADVACGVAYGANPTAAALTTTSANATGTMRLAANISEYFELGGAGGTRLLAVIATT